MPRKVHIDRVMYLIDTALASGGKRKSVYTVHWDISGDCTNPFHSEIWGRPVIYPGEREKIIRPGKENTPQVLEIETRCRKCERCLRMRARRWYGAAKREIAASSRTWFGTLTLSPDNHHLALERARAKLALQGVDFDCLNAHDQYVERHKAIGPELTKYIKRIRKNSGAHLRYLLVAEAHESGLPHYHLLIHERPLGGTVSHRILSEAWGLGFEKIRLSDPDKPSHAAYLCKYLSKSLSARVRASQGYGATDSGLHTHVVNELRRVREKREKNEDAAANSPSLSSLIDPLFASLYLF